MTKIPISKCIPIMITDIDGVIVRGADPIPGIAGALKKLNKLKIPYACLTNAGGQTQKAKTQKMNQNFGQQLFSPDSMFMNHTPMKPQLVRNSKKDGLVMITGSRDVFSILKDLKISNYITADEMFCMVNQDIHDNNYFQEENQASFNNYPHLRLQLRERLATRLNIPIDSLPKTYRDWEQRINSLFALNDVSPYQTTLQCIHNIFSIRKQNGEQLPHYYAAQNDIVWASRYPKPRIAFGPFNRILAAHCKAHQFDLQQTTYGKPTMRAFQFVEKTMKERHPNAVIFFMAGDNPHSDIRGANSIGWDSFLTRTGVHHSVENDKEDPATFVVDSFVEAVNIMEDLHKRMAEL